MSTDYTEVGSERYVALLPSAVRAATPNVQQVHFTQDVDAIVVVVKATAVGATGNVTITIEGVDDVTQATYPILIASTTAIINNTNTATTYAYKVAQSLTAGVGGTGMTHTQAANDLVPATIRITMTHDAGTNFTYSVSLLCPS